MKIKDKYKGIIFIICAAFCFALMNLFVKLSGDLPTFEKAFFRNVVAIFFSGVVLIKNKTKISIPKGAVSNVLLRAIFGTVGIFCNFYAISNLPISDASMLNKLSPFFAIIFSIFLLKEKVKFYQIMSVVAAFIGACFILQPGGAFTNFIPALIGFISGAAAGFAYTNLRVATKKGVQSPVIVFIFSVFSCLVSVPFIIADYKPISWLQLVFLLLAGLSATGGQFSITAAYKYAPAREISVYDYSQVLFAAIIGFFVLGEMPNWLSYIGYAIIIGAGVFMFLKSRKQVMQENNL